MSGMADWQAKISIDVEDLKKRVKVAEGELDKITKEDRKIKLDLDTKTLESAIQKLDKMLDSLGKGTGDFKQLESLSKELSSIATEVQSLSKAFGKVDDSGAKTLLSSIQNIDKSLSELSQNILNVNKNMSNMGGNTSGAVRQVENIGNAAADAVKQVDKLADAQSKLGENKTNFLSGNNVEKSIPTYEQVYEILNKIAIAYDGVTKNANEAQAVVNKLGDNTYAKNFEDELLALGKGIGKETISVPKLSLKPLSQIGNSETTTKEIDAQDKLRTALSNTVVTYDNFENVLKTVCNILGVEIPQNADKAAKTIQQLGAQISTNDSWKNGLNESEIKAVNNALDEMRNSISTTYSKDNMITDLVDALNYIKTLNPDEFVSYIKTVSSEYQNFINSITHYRESNQQTLNGEYTETNWAFNFSNYLKSIQSVTQAEEKMVEVQKEISSTTPEKDLKDAFQGNDEITSSSEKVSNAIKEENNILEQNIQKAKENAEAKEKMANANKEVSNANFSKYDNRLESYNKKTSGYDATIARFEDGGWTSDAYLRNVQAVKDAVAEYERILNNLKAHPELVTEEGLNDLAKQEKLIKENINTIQNMTAAQKGYTQLSGQKAMDKINSLLKENSNMSRTAKDQIRAWYNEIKSGNPSASLDVILGKVQEIVNAEIDAGRGGKSMLDAIKEKAWYGVASTIGTYFGLNDIIRYGRQAISTIVELDDALVDLKKTTSMSSSELENFYYDSNDVAKQMGVTTQAIIEQASAWSRLNKIGLLYGDI